MSKWNSYNSSKFQVESLFRSNAFQQSQKDELVKILNVMAKYMLVDRNILNKRAGKKIGLSHIQRAINLNLIVELKDYKAFDKSFEVEDHHYFYVLGFAGINFLRIANRDLYCFNIADNFESKKKVLMFNYEALSKDYELLFSTYNDIKNYNFFHCKTDMNKDIILYFEDYISINHLRAIMKNKFISQLSEEQFEFKDELFEKFISKFNFHIINLRPTGFDENLKSDEGTISNRILYNKRFNDERV